MTEKTAWETSLAKLCEVHGVALIELGSRVLCPQCLDHMTLARRHVAARHDEAEREEMIRRRLVQSKIPPRYHHASFESLKLSPGHEDRMKRLYAAMSRYCEDFATFRDRRTGFLFVGEPGTGKTHLACTMAIELIKRGYKARYISMPSLTLEIRASYKDRNVSVQGLIQDLVHADFLVVDEIDLHGASDADYQVLYEIINARYVAGGRPVLALSNRTKDFLMKDLNERIISRILGEYPENNFNWPAFR